MNHQDWSRRDLLGVGAAGLSTALTAALPAEAQHHATQPARQRHDETAPHRFKISLAGYSFRNDLDQPGKPGKMSLLDMVDLAVRLGLDAIEPTSYYFLRTDDEFINSLKRRAFLAGIEISGTPVRNNFCLPPGPELDQELAHVNNWVDIAVKLGSPVMRIFAGSKPKTDAPRDQVFEHLAAATKRACEYAGSKGVFLAIEDHGFMTETADDLLRLLDAVQSDWLGINLDTGNFSGDPYAEIAKAAPRAIVCQVKALVRKPGSSQQEPADFARIFRILRDAGYRGYVTLEYEGNDPHREVPQYIRKLQALAQV